jgi:LysR family carnitine catabolism transcriptional activator
VSAHIPDISVKHLNAIVSLARYGSFVAAASYLGISQPGLSRVIRQAEDILGADLFERGSRKVTLTPAGREFLPFAESLLGELAHRVESLRAGHGQAPAQIVIASLMSISHLVLPAALVRFRELYPAVFVQIHEGFGVAIAENVRTGIADFGIGSPEGLPKGVAPESVLEESFYAVLPRDHELAGRDVLALADLQGCPLISMPTESGLRRIIDAAAGAQAVELTHSIVTNQYASIFRFVARGLGVTIVPATSLPPIGDENVTVRSLSPSINRKVAVLTREDRSLSAESEAFLRILRPLLMKGAAGSRDLI